MKIVYAVPFEPVVQSRSIFGLNVFFGRMAATQSVDNFIQ